MDPLTSSKIIKVCSIIKVRVLGSLNFSSNDYLGSSLAQRFFEIRRASSRYRALLLIIIE